MLYFSKLCPAGHSACATSVLFRSEFRVNIPWTIAEGYDFVSGLSSAEAIGHEEFYFNSAKMSDAAIIVGLTLM